jgi:hypothetical protein
LAKGRPSDYSPELAEQAAKLCRMGATDYELADFFGVDTRTIYRWKNSHEDFCQAVIVGKDAADERVARSLYNRAVGYTFESEKLVTVSQGANMGSVVERHAIVEHVPPDPGAAFNWLKNRRGAEWRDKQDVTHSGEMTVVSKDQRDASVAAAARADT